jgi:hypothetical protein
MGRFVAIACALIASGSAAWAADLPVLDEQGETSTEGWTATLDSDIRYFVWRSHRSDGFRARGSQVYIPFGLQLAGPLAPDLQLEFIGRGGWVHSRQSTTEGSGEVRTITDTVAAATFSYSGFDGFQPFASFDFNLPTGRSALQGNEVNARMDPDLVDIPSFGEGFNFGPTIGVNIPITENLIATWSVGYTWRGAYNQEGPVHIEPGNTLTFTGSIGYQIGNLAGKITGMVSTDTDTKIDGMRHYRPGMRFLLAGSWSYAWPESAGATTLNASVSHALKNKVMFLDQVTLDPVRFDTEPFNSNSNLYRIGLDHMFAVGQMMIGPTGSFLYRDRNTYDPRTLQFVPAKTRWSAGFLARHSPSERVSFSVRAEHVWVRERDTAPGTAKDSLLLLPPPGTTTIDGLPATFSTGWQFSIGAYVSF